MSHGKKKQTAKQSGAREPVDDVAIEIDAATEPEVDEADEPANSTNLANAPAAGDAPPWSIDASASKPLQHVWQLLNIAAAKAAASQGKAEEPAGPERRALVAALLDVHAAIEDLTVADVGGDEARLIRTRANLYAKAAPLGPYFEQGKNANLLGSDTKNAAQRTCNITVIAMNLEMLGMSTKSYTPLTSETKKDKKGKRTTRTLSEKELIAQVVKEYGSALDSSGALSNNDVLTADSLRMPDFLQVLEIVKALPEAAHERGSAFRDEIRTARHDAMNNILFSGKFGDLIAGWNLTTRRVQPFKTEQTKLIDQIGRINKGGVKPELKKRASKRNKEEAEAAALAGAKKGKQKRWTLENLPEDEKQEVQAAIGRYWDERPEVLKREIAALPSLIAQGEAEVASLRERIAAVHELIAEPDPEPSAADPPVPPEAKPEAAAKGRGKGKGRTQAKSAYKIGLVAQLKALQDAKTNTASAVAKNVERLRDDPKEVKRLEHLVESGVNKIAGSPAELDKLAGGIISLEKYKAVVSAALTAELDAGHTVVGHLHNHFINVERVTDQGIVIDDPGTAARKNHTLTWEEGRSLGAFTGFTVIERQSP